MNNLIDNVGFKPQTETIEKDNPCKPSIVLTDREYSFGVPQLTELDISYAELDKRLREHENIKNNKDKLFELAYIAFELGKFDIAEKYLLETEKINRFSVSRSWYEGAFISLLAETYDRKGQFETARRYYGKLGDKYYLHLIQAKIYLLKNEIEKAEREYLLAQSVELYEEINIEPYKKLAEMFLLRANYIKAKYYIEKYLKCAESARRGEQDFGSPCEGDVEVAKILLETIKKHL
jgi:tetratricopeptide (TPR) repeat protein